MVSFSLNDDKFYYYYDTYKNTFSTNVQYAWASINVAHLFHVMKLDLLVS